MKSTTSVLLEFQVNQDISYEISGHLTTEKLSGTRARVRPVDLAC